MCKNKSEQFTMVTLSAGIGVGRAGLPAVKKQNLVVVAALPRQVSFVDTRRLFVLIISNRC